MKVLFDQNVPKRLAARLTAHEVTRSAQLGWEELKNGDLLKAAETAGFECMVTADRNMAYQQNLKQRKIAIVVLPTNDWGVLEPKVQDVVRAVDVAKDNSFAELAPLYRQKRPRGPSR